MARGQEGELQKAGEPEKDALYKTNRLLPAFWFRYGFAGFDDFDTALPTQSGAATLLNPSLNLKVVRLSGF